MQTDIIEMQLEAFKREQNECLKLYVTKNREYNGSFYENDLTAAYYDMRRKWIRIQNLIGPDKIKDVKEDILVELVVEQLRDIANYAVMTSTKITKQKGC